MGERGPRQQRRRPRGPRGIGGSARGRLDLVPAPGAPHGVGQREQQPRALGLVDGLVALPGGERTAQQLHGLLEGEPRRGLVGGPQGIGHRAVDLLRPRRGEVARELGEVRLEPVAELLLDRLADPAMQARAARRASARPRGWSAAARA